MSLLPGLRTGEDRARLLARLLPNPRGATLILGEAVTATALWAASAAPPLHLWLDSAAEARSVEESLRARHLPTPTLHLDPRGEGLPLRSFQTVLLLLPRGRALQRVLWQAAAALVHPRGTIAFVGEKREGIRTALAEGRALLGKAAILRRKGGLHAGLAAPPPAPLPFPTPKLRYIPLHLEGREVEIAACEGIFAAGRLDAGAAALITAMEVEAGHRCLDLGCGSGIVGLAAALRGGEIVATDLSARAVYATRATFQRNGLTAEVHHTLGGEGLPAASFDRVLTNPPFHSGRRRTEAVADFFIAESRRLLRPGGKLYLVGNAFLPYGARIRLRFAQVRLVHDDGRYRVWEAKA